MKTRVIQNIGKSIGQHVVSPPMAQYDNAGAPAGGVPIVQPTGIDVKTPAGVGIGKNPHDRPVSPMVVPPVPAPK